MTLNAEYTPKVIYKVAALALLSWRLAGSTYQKHGEVSPSICRDGDTQDVSDHADGHWHGDVEGSLVGFAGMDRIAKGSEECESIRRCGKEQGNDLVVAESLDNGGEEVGLPVLISLLREKARRDSTYVGHSSVQGELNQNEHVDLGVLERLKAAVPHRLAVFSVILPGNLNRKAPDRVLSLLLSKPLHIYDMSVSPW